MNKEEGDKLETHQHTGGITHLKMTFDIGLYCIWYVCFLYMVFPILVGIYLEGVEMPEVTILFYTICFFCRRFLYIPIIIFWGGIVWCEYSTKIFHAWYVQFMAKCFILLFFISTMFFLSAPLWRIF